MIQDIAPHRLDNVYYAEQTPKPEDCLIIYKDRQLLVRVNEEEGTFDFPKILEVTKLSALAHLDDEDIKSEKYIYLFAVDDKRFFLLNCNKDDECVSGVETDKEYSVNGYSFMTVRSLTSHPLEPKIHAYAAFTSMHLAEWYSRQRFCGRCGHPLTHSDSERAMKCDKCGYIIYPRLNPAVIVGVKNGDSILLTKYRRGYGYNALVAGFVEIGETIEECVAREVKEETGLSVKNITYYKSQPWGIAGDLLAGFYCDVDGDDAIKMDEGELKYAKWVKREDIKLQPADYSLTNEMMKMFKEHKQ